MGGTWSAQPRRHALDRTRRLLPPDLQSRRL